MKGRGWSMKGSGWSMKGSGWSMKGSGWSTKGSVLLDVAFDPDDQPDDVKDRRARYRVVPPRVQLQRNDEHLLDAAEQVARRLLQLVEQQAARRCCRERRIVSGTGRRCKHRERLCKPRTTRVQAEGDTCSTHRGGRGSWPGSGSGTPCRLSPATARARRGRRRRPAGALRSAAR